MGRLSEDLDLIAVGPRGQAASRLDLELVRAVQRDYGLLTWRPPLSSIRDVESASLMTSDGLTLRIQLLSAAYSDWPTEIRQLDQRYSDAPSAAMRVPTLPAFVAWKTTAWFERAAPRDLWDLWALAQIGAITPEAATLFRQHGPTGAPPRPWMFRNPPSQPQWEAQLGGQTHLDVSAKQALHAVARAWHGSISE